MARRQLTTAVQKRIKQLGALLLAGGASFLAGTQLDLFEAGSTPAWVEDGDTFEEQRFTRSGFFTKRFGDAPIRATFRRVELISDDLTKWGHRLYDFVGTWEECYVHGFGRLWQEPGVPIPPGGSIEGHAWYVNVGPGSSSWIECVAAECHGQAWQIEFRDGTIDPITGRPEGDETNLEPPTADDVLLWERCGSYNNGRAPCDRCSWPWAIYNPGATVIVRDSWCTTIGLEPWQDPVKGESASRGALYIGPGQESASRTPRAVVENFIAVLDRSDRAALHFRGVDELLVQGGFLLDVSGRPARIYVAGDVAAWAVQGVGGDWELHHDRDSDMKVDAGELLPMGAHRWP